MSTERSAENRFADIPYNPSPHHSSRRTTTIDLVVLHYTAGNGDAESTAKFFAKSSRKASAHFCIGRDGEVVQCVDLDRSAWHAGSPSAFRGKQPVGPRSIGIELCNRGYASTKNPRITARHRNPASKSTLWEVYPAEQIGALRTLLVQLFFVGSVRFVTGHEDIRNKYVVNTPGSKLDPGPAFPWYDAITGIGLERWLYDFGSEQWAHDTPQMP